jgi:hypothetical protein
VARPTSGPRQRRILFALVGLALVAAACERAGPDDVAPDIRPGICVADEIRDQGDLAPDLSSIVDCREPHVYEVYDILDIPANALAGTTRQERIANRDDLALPSELPDDSAERQAFEDFAEVECAASLQNVTGYDELKLRDASAKDARVVPALRGINAPWYTVMPEKEWLDGRRQIVCSARFEDPEHTGAGRTPAKPQISEDDRMLLTKVSDQALPVSFRECRAYDDARREVAAASCAEPHADEALFYFEADAVFDQRFIASIVRRPTPKKFDRFDEVCTGALAQLIGPDYDRKAVRGFGSVARRWTKNNKTVRCSVGAVDFRNTDLAPGSQVSAGADAKLAPAQ